MTDFYVILYLGRVSAGFVSVLEGILGIFLVSAFFRLMTYYCKSLLQIVDGWWIVKRYPSFLLRMSRNGSNVGCSILG